MEVNEDKKRRIIDRFNRHVATAGSGIFTKSDREKLLGKKRIWGARAEKEEVLYAQKELLTSIQRQTVNTFWYRTRNKVRTALKDLQFFIESADKSNVNQVVTSETLKPIVDALLYHPILDEEAPDRKRAEIAGLFIKAGFEYLRVKSGNLVSLSHGRTIEEALNLSSLLVKYFREE